LPDEAYQHSRQALPQAHQPKQVAEAGAATGDSRRAFRCRQNETWYSWLILFSFAQFKDQKDLPG
jgi:hypothetical protein